MGLYTLIGVVTFWLSVFAIDALNIPLPTTEMYCKRNTEECLEWVLEAK